MASYNLAFEALKTHATPDKLFSNPNVTYASVVAAPDRLDDFLIEVGHLYDEPRGDVAARFVQATKKEDSVTGAYAPIPETLEVAPQDGKGQKVTVPVRSCQSGPVLAQSFTDRQRPAHGGDSCGNFRYVNSGTLGARIEHNGVAYILSNWHVLYGPMGQDGDAILQPSREDGGLVEDNVIAFNSNGVLNDYLDAAIAQIRDPVDDFVATGTRCFGPVNGIADAANGMIARKCGRTTGATIGEVRSTNTVVRVGGYPNGDRIFYDQIQLTPMSLPGDSGSLVLTTENRAIGLLFAGGESASFANKIQRLLPNEAQASPLMPASGSVRLA